MPDGFFESDLEITASRLSELVQLFTTVISCDNSPLQKSVDPFLKDGYILNKRSRDSGNKYEKKGEHDQQID